MGFNFARAKPKQTLSAFLQKIILSPASVGMVTGVIEPRIKISIYRVPARATL